MGRKSWASALAIAQKMLNVDPLQEHVHRAMMRCHYLMGNRPGAVRQFTACVQLLRRELGVEPMEETTRVL
jgi:DNA-binding SARP family transcriptional activator